MMNKINLLHYVVISFDKKYCELDCFRLRNCITNIYTFIGLNFLFPPFFLKQYFKILNLTMCNPNIASHVKMSSSVDNIKYFVHGDPRMQKRVSSPASYPGPSAYEADALAI